MTIQCPHCDARKIYKILNPGTQIKECSSCNKLFEVDVDFVLSSIKKYERIEREINFNYFKGD
jgi:transcription elongation factor Elf1